MSEFDYREREVLEREHARWLAYQKEGLAPADVIRKEKDWARSSLKSALSNWQRCVLYAVCGGLLTGISVTLLIAMRDSSSAVACAVLGILVGAGAMALFAKEAMRKPVIHKSRSWLLAEQQLSGGK